MDKKFLERPVNEGFSGGEKKRNEILQMCMLEPKFAVLDETDSGLDIDALRIVADGVNRMRSPERGIVVVTHYQRLLDYIKPDFVHVLSGGQIVKSGDSSLAHQLLKRKATVGSRVRLQNKRQSMTSALNCKPLKRLTRILFFREALRHFDEIRRNGVAVLTASVCPRANMRRGVIQT